LHPLKYPTRLPLKATENLGEVILTSNHCKNLSGIPQAAKHTELSHTPSLNRL